MDCVPEVLQIVRPDPSSAAKQLMSVPLVHSPSPSEPLHTSHDPASPLAGQIMHFVPEMFCVLLGGIDHDVGLPSQPVPVQPPLQVVNVYAKMLGAAERIAVKIASFCIVLD